MSEAVLEAGRALGIPEAVTRAFVRRLRPCVYLCRYDFLPEELKRDARPAARGLGPFHLPEDAEAPFHLPHLMTIDCAVIPAGSLDIAFPADGHLVVFGSITDDEACGVIHVAAGTETVERRPDKERLDPDGTFLDPFPLYAVAGTTGPADYCQCDVPEAVVYAGDLRQCEMCYGSEGVAVADTAGDAYRGDRLNEFMDEIGEILDVRSAQGIQLGGYSRAWHVPVEEFGNTHLFSIAESSFSGRYGFNALISGTPEQIAECRYDGLRCDIEGP